MTLGATTIQPLPSGDAGTYYTLNAMAEMVRRDVADPTIRGYAEQIVTAIQPHDFKGEIEAIFDYVRTIPYRRHPVDVQRVVSALNAIQMSYLDCVSKSVLLSTLLGSLGHISRFAIIRQGAGEFDHVYIEANIGGQWVPLDPTPDTNTGGYADIGFEPSNLDKRVFAIWPGTVGGHSLSGACCSSCAAGGSCESRRGLGDGLGIAPLVIPAIMGAIKLTEVIAGIFVKHGQRVYQEDEISGQWAALGAPMIPQIREAFDKGQLTAEQAGAALDQIEQEFRATVQPISKLKGHFGFMPNVDGPRPDSECNWACGTSWDLHQQIKQMKVEMEQGASSGPPLWQQLGYASKSEWKAAGRPDKQTAIVVPPTGSILSSSPDSSSSLFGIPMQYLLFGALGIGALMVLKK